MEHWKKMLEERSQPLFIQRIYAKHIAPEPLRSNAANKICIWLKSQPISSQNGPLLATDVAAAIHESVTATGRALRELGCKQRKGGAIGDNIRLYGRRVWFK
jgi:hypothetical protein